MWSFALLHGEQAGGSSFPQWKAGGMHRHFACVCLCMYTCVEGGTGFSVGRYCSGVCNTDPWVLLTQMHRLLFYLLSMAKALPRQP